MSKLGNEIYQEGIKEGLKIGRKIVTANLLTILSIDEIVSITGLSKNDVINLSKEKGLYIEENPKNDK